jgi:nucleotide-binding universal stress UspA family protein
MRILLAVDGSPAADRACDLVTAMPPQAGGTVRIISVAPSLAELINVPWAIAATPDAGEIEADALRRHAAAVESAAAELRSARSDVEIESVVRRGRPASVILEEACEMSADLIVVGHRGHGTWASLLLGSVSAEVVDHAPCPVLVARGERLGPVILADDGSTYARAAEGALLHWPIFAGLPITVLTVAERWFPYAAAIEPLDYSMAIDAYASEDKAVHAAAGVDSEAAAERLRRAGLDARAEVRDGDPAHEIIAVASTLDAGLIVVGTRGQTGLRRLILGSVARKVLLHASCSVLVVRGGTRVPQHPAETADPELVSSFG